MKKVFSFITVIVVSLSTIYAETTTIIINNPETWKASDLSAYVGQTVTFATPFYVTNNYYNISRNQLTISPRRIYSPTNQELPASTAYQTLISANNTGTVTLTNQTTYHRMGEMIKNLTVQVQSTSTLVPVGTPEYYGNTRADMASHPNIGDYNLKVCGFNLEYYLVENYGSGTMGPLTAAEQTAQHSKIMKALTAIDADIYGLVEIEQGQAALAKLASSLNAAKGVTTYTYINDGSSANGTYTKAGYVYNSAVVTPYGQLQSNNTGVSYRKKIQAFTLNSNNEKFVFSINHFKAKSGTGTGADADQGDGQGIFNATRVLEAESVITMLNNKKSYFGDEDFLVMGDLNAYAKEDPIRTFTDNGFYDLHRAFHADTSYSYTYHGQVGYLDHALANSTMYRQISGMAAYHINSDEDDTYTYDGSQNDNTMFRCSDHDPVIVGIMLNQSSTNSMSFTDRVKINTAEFCANEAPLCITDAANSYLYVYSLSGVQVGYDKIDSDNYLVNTSGWQSGVYIMNIFGDGVLKQVKIVAP